MSEDLHNKRRIETQKMNQVSSLINGLAKFRLFMTALLNPDFPLGLLQMKVSIKNKNKRVES